jgi:hypothetical protein
MAEHLIVMEQFDKVLRSGVMYPRWLPDLNKGYGSAWPNFYPPGFYYLTSAVHIIFADWVNTLFIVTILVLGCSFLTFYKLSRIFYGRFASAAAALLYSLWPYHILNLYWRGAMPEFAGAALGPLIVFFAHLLGEHSRAKYYAGLGLTYGALVLIHLPGGYLMAWPVALYGLLLGVEKRNWKIPLRVWSGLGIGLLIAAVYWLPAAIEAKYAYENISAIFPYGESYLPLARPADYFVELLNKTLVAQITALLAGLIVILYIMLRRAKTSQGPLSIDPPEGTALPVTAQVRPVAILALATTLMTTALSAPVSSILPKIQLVGFPCRWLAVSGLFTALLVGAAIEGLTTLAQTNRLKLWTGGAVLLAVIVLNVGATIGWVVLRALSNPPLRIPDSLIEPNYTPKDSMPPDQLPDAPPARLMLQEGSTLIGRWDPQYREITEESRVQNWLRLKSYYFPGWAARIDDHPCTLIGDGAGFQTIMVPPGKHRIDVFLGDTPARNVGTLCSGAGLLLICILALVHWRNIRPPSGNGRVGTLVWRKVSALARSHVQS